MRKNQQNRTRKAESQIQTLINEFRANPSQSKERVSELASLTRLSESQVYKWAWDQRKKFEKGNEVKVSKKTPVKSFGYSQQTVDIKSGRTLTLQGEVTRDEFGGYCCKKLSKSDDLSDDQIQNDICKMLGLNIEKEAYEAVRSEFGLEDRKFNYGS